MFQKSKFTIEFPEGISQAYPTKLEFLRDYLPAVCAKRTNYNMKSLAADMDMSPSQLSQKLSGANNTAWSTKDDDRLKDVLTASEYLDIIAYDVESTQREYNRIEELERELAELKAGRIEMVRGKVS